MSPSTRLDDGDCLPRRIRDHRGTTSATWRPRGRRAASWRSCSCAPGNDRLARSPGPHGEPAGGRPGSGALPVRGSRSDVHLHRLAQLRTGPPVEPEVFPPVHCYTPTTAARRSWRFLDLEERAAERRRGGSGPVWGRRSVRNGRVELDERETSRLRSAMRPKSLQDPASIGGDTVKSEAGGTTCGSPRSVPRDGRWEELIPLWWETDQVFCDFCGRLIPRRIWVAEIEGRDLPFCDAECEELYLSACVPRKPSRRGATAERPQLPFGQFPS
jgi:hypothetical protein